MEASTIQIKKRLYHSYWFLAIFVVHYSKTLYDIYDDSLLKKNNAGQGPGQDQGLGPGQGPGPGPGKGPDPGKVSQLQILLNIGVAGAIKSAIILLTSLD